MKKIEDLLSERKELKLDLGCGSRKVSEIHIGIDKAYVPGVDIILDLEKGKLPFENNSVDEVVASHILEHISNYIPLMEEIWRIIKPGANLFVRVPHYLHEGAYTDPTHVRRFTRKSFHFFDSRKVLYRESGWYLSLARFRVDDVQESNNEILYTLTAQKKKILLVAPASSIHTKRWKEYLLSTSHDVKVASRVIKGVADVCLGINGLSKDKQIENLPRVLEKILANHSFDVVHAHFSTRYGHTLTVVPDTIRKVLSVWGEDVLDEAVKNANCRKRLIGGLIHARYITTTSEHMANILEKEYSVSKDKIWVFPWGYEDLFFEKSVENSERLKEFTVPSEGKVLLSARVCRPQNNIEKIIESFNKSKVEGTLIILEGSLADKTYVKKLKRKTRSNKNIIFLPNLSERDLALLYNRAVAVISLPKVDQLSTTLLESLTCGTPVICSNIPPYAERITHGVNGFLIDICDIRGIADAIKRSFTEEGFKERMREASIQSVRYDSWKENSRNMLKVYDAPG